MHLYFIDLFVKVIFLFLFFIFGLLGFEVLIFFSFCSFEFDL